MQTNRANLINREMNDQTYNERRKVISIIYQCLRLNKSLPRVEVRIVENKGNVLGRATIFSRVPHISITKQAFSSEDMLHNVVLHELCHTWFDAMHDETCPLMRSTINKPLTKDKAFEIFKEYLKDYKSWNIYYIF